jgi:mannan endo-1,4-beta-mannosidase
MKHRVDNSHRKRRRIVMISVGLVAMAVIAVGVSLYGNLSTKSNRPTGPLPVHLPTTPQSYLGVYTNAAPSSYSGVTAFANVTGARPNILMYYSGWYEPFQTSFATKAAKNGAVPLVQMNPEKISISAIAAGKYDGYLSAYAEAVRAYRHPVILSFGHEMNGTWYSWGYRHTSPAAFVAAWRHIVTLFRALGARNVTWLWTVNIINDTQQGRIPPPAPWWPGNAYVTWVGIDGYYLKPGWQFAPLFGPTVAAVRSLTRDPILIGETGATTDANQPAKIADVFSGIHAYGLLGFIWFDARNYQGLDFRINTPASTAAFRNGAGTFTRPGS